MNNENDHRDEPGHELANTADEPGNVIITGSEGSIQSVVH